MPNEPESLYLFEDEAHTPDLHAVTKRAARRNGTLVTGRANPRYGGRRKNPLRKYPTNAARQKAYRQRQKRRSVHFLSTTPRWETPQALFDALDAEFQFATDVCADATNAKCAHYFSPEQDGLRQRWEGVCWMNPPYGKEIAWWVLKAYDASRYGATVVCLLPARTDTAWWQRWVLPCAAEIRYLPGRQKFSQSGNGAPFPSAVVIFRPPPLP